MEAKAYKIEKGYFRNNPNYGRTTKLIEKSTGKVVFEGMGICTKQDLLNSIKK